jgi:hypothetical protein
MRKFAVVVLGIVGLISLGVSQEAKAQKESYSAMALAGNSGASQVRFNFTITKWSTDEEVKALGTILKEQGEDALIEALKKLDAGRINKVGDTGNQIAIAQKMQSGKQWIITMITARKISTVELSRQAAHADYPLGFLQVIVDEKGNGSGKMMTAAKVKYDKNKGHFHLEPYGNGYTPVENVTKNE